jgi:hypothetical protein
VLFALTFVTSIAERELALSYVASCIVESIIIVVGLISLLSVLTLRDDFAGAGADAGSLTVAGKSLVAFHDWTFLLGPGFLRRRERALARLPVLPVRPGPGCAVKSGVV